MSEYICEICSKKYKFKTSFEKHVRYCSKPVKEPVNEPVKVEQKEPEHEKKEPLSDVKEEDRKIPQPDHLEHIPREECNCVHCDKRFVTIDILKFIGELENKNLRIQELEQCVDKLYQKLVECRKAYVHLFDLYDEKLNKHNYEDDD